MLLFSFYYQRQGILTKGGRLSTVALLIEVACFVKMVNNIFNIKWTQTKLVSTKRSIVLKPSLSGGQLY